MYDYIFIFCLQFNERVKSNDPRFYAASFMTLVIIFHLLLTFSILKYFEFIEIPTFLQFDNRYYYLPFAIALIFGVERIYTKRADKIIEKYKDKRIDTFINGTIVFLLTFIPLIVAIGILKK